MKVFVEKGFKGSTTIEIAKAADISEVTLFRYFKSKQEIFLQGIEPILFNTLEGSLNSEYAESSGAKLENILYQISFIDFAPTFCELSGAKMPTDRKIDGTSILPVFKNQKLVRKTPLFCYFYSILLWTFFFFFKQKTAYEMLM